MRFVYTNIGITLIFVITVFLILDRIFDHTNYCSWLTSTTF